MGGIELTPEGIELLERTVIKGFIQNPSEIRSAANVLELDVDATLKKYLKKYFEIEEDLDLIKSGAEPIHNPIDYYLPNRL